MTALSPSLFSRELDGKPITGDENVFDFRVSWASPSDFYYVSDGKIRRRSTAGDDAKTIGFKATLQVTRVNGSYPRRKRDLESVVPRQALGIVRPVISTDGKKVAFAAVGDIYIMDIGGKPVNITKDKYLDTDPAWSPDGRRITFFDVGAMWRAATVSVVDVASGEVTQIHASLFGPGMPTWAPDGKRTAVAMVSPYSHGFREGTNQVLTMPSENGLANSADKWFVPVPNLSIDSRGFCAPRLVARWRQNGRHL
jgi:dipeptidyl aminopeptidase/acylaminoacyl peptidase